MLALLVFAGAEARPATVPEFQFAARRMRSNELALFKRAPEEAAEAGGRPAAARFLRSKDRARSSALAPPSESTRTELVAGTASGGSLGSDEGARDSCDEAAAEEGCLHFGSATD